MSLVGGLLLLASLFGAVGCDTIDGEEEVTGVVEGITEGTITVDGISYFVTAETTFSGYGSLQDVSIGDTVEVEYEEDGAQRTAIEINAVDGDDENDDGDDDDLL